ncbi:MAG TPA: hypothetical protein VF018_08090 [Acidobacteriaceae bacterium]
MGPSRRFAINDNRDLDELLDAALASYVDEEPDPSLRARIYARAAEAAPWRTRMWLMGTAAACATALLSAFLLHPAGRILQDRAAHAPDMPPPLAASAKLDHTLTPDARPHVVAATHGSHSRGPSQRRRSISLASAPLTDEETTLLRFAQQHPEQARQVLSPPPSGAIQTDPLVIAPIQIADLAGSQPDAH